MTPARLKALAAAFEAHRRGLQAQLIGSDERVKRIKRNMGRDPALNNADSLRVAEAKLAEAIQALKDHDLRTKQRLGE